MVRIPRGEELHGVNLHSPPVLQRQDGMRGSMGAGAPYSTPVRPYCGGSICGSGRGGPRGGRLDDRRRRPTREGHAGAGVFRRVYDLCSACASFGVVRAPASGCVGCLPTAGRRNVACVPVGRPTWSPAPIGDSSSGDPVMWRPTWGPDWPPRQYLSAMGGTLALMGPCLVFEFVFLCVLSCFSPYFPTGFFLSEDWLMCVG